jgi:signal transduction histidine kinase
MAKINITQKISAFIVMMLALFFYSACDPSHKQEVDRLNTLSYAYHYRDLDSTKMLAQRALALSDDYSAGYAEACNNLAFVEMAKMNYKEARRWLGLVEEKSNNQLELLIADVQMMRICQRESHNKDFYSYREKAMVRLRRLGEEASNLPPRERRRATYAHSEFDIVDATYCYYVGLEEPMLKALNDIDADALEADTAQYLNYLYNIGSGGAITNGTSEQIAQTEFDYLIQCYMLASAGRVVMSDGTMAGGYPYWQANALQAISEHLQNGRMRDFLIRNNLPAIQYLNVEQMPDTLLAGNLAQRALNLFISYGDTYQIAGGYRTLAECYFAIEDYNSAGDCLLRALQVSKNIKSAPDLVASIRERLCLVYSALDNKQQSDYNRNIYLDLQERTRQDRQLEARATLLDDNALQLNLMIAAVLVMILLVVILLYLFDRMRRRKIQSKPLSSLLEPLEQWKQRNAQYINDINEITEELNEEISIARVHLDDNKKRNLEQRAKVSLVNSITPFIDRMIHEVDKLAEDDESTPDEVKQERYEYISELTDKINQYNTILTNWIQMRQGTLNLRIVSFPLQPLFDIVAKGKMSFQMKKIKLDVQPTAAKVKADRTLTLFMINTIADNARKFTPAGGKVTVSAEEHDKYVEIVIADTGKGMDEEQLAHVFDRTYTGGHGFGLLNCKGIIEKYKKVSSIFNICLIEAESEVGKGSVFRFRLPKGIGRMIVGVILLLASSVSSFASQIHQHTLATGKVSRELTLADAFADSAYFSNINGTYQRTLAFADSAIYYLNQHYLRQYPQGKNLMVSSPKLSQAAELKWFADSVTTDYSIILDIRNESAVAALALHQWTLYDRNNKVYTKLFRERSTDNTLPEYVRTMQSSENSKTVAVILLFLLLLQLPIAYYLLYYRHVVTYRFAVDRIRDINLLLLSDQSIPEKLKRIRDIWSKKSRHTRVNFRLDEVVHEIEEELKRGQDLSNGKEADNQLLEDELRRVRFENDRLHVSNSVLDNCLSTLKHETMYYPSRIRQLIEASSDDVASLKELVDYYKSIYLMLSAQAMEQVETNLKCDAALKDYLFRLIQETVKDLAKAHGIAITQVKQEIKTVHTAYATCQFVFSELRYDDSLHHRLFTPLTVDMRFLVCRQIVREMGETTNLRGCGIQAKPSDDGFLVIEVVLPGMLV